MGQILTVNDVLLCPHGGTVLPAAQQARASADRGPILRPVDTFTVAGCTLNVLGALHPCVIVEWQNPSPRVKAGGAGVLTTASIGLCKAADQVLQGTVLIQKTQTKASAQ